jgi:hypothetical protein
MGRAVLENTTAAIVFKNRNHVYTATTAAFRAATYGLLGGREVIGLTDYDFLPARDADVYYALEEQILSGKPRLDEVARSSAWPVARGSKYACTR